jgi:prevent-host-death family protein
MVTRRARRRARVVLSNNDKGDIAEAALTFRATGLGIRVLRPWSGHARYDLVFDVGGRLLRVQCKWGRLDCADSVICIRCGSSRHAPTGYVRTTYGEDEVDLFGIYCGALDRCYLLPSQLVAGKHHVQLRLTRPRNSQRAGVILAGDYEFHGAIAQLGERSAGSRKVAGSNPASSTSPSDPEILVTAHELREKFGYWMQRASAGANIVVTRRGKRLLRLMPVRAPAATAPIGPSDA